MSDADALYHAAILAHDRAPQHPGPLAGATHRATVDSPLCGDVVTLELRLEGGAIQAAAATTLGCALARAAGSILTGLLVGRDAEAARALAADFEAFITAPAEPHAPAPAAAGAPPAAAPAAPAAAEAAHLGELVAFTGVRRVRSRRACALLPFRALREALAPRGPP